VSPRRFPLAFLFPEAVMDHISTLTLHKLRYNELDPAESEATRAHIRSCERCSGRLAVLDNQRAAFELEPMPPALRALAEKERSSPWQRLLGFMRQPAALGILAAAAGLMLVVSLGDGLPGERSKGDEISEVIVEGIGVLGEGQAIRAGDRLQLRVPPGDWEQVWIGDGESLLAPFPMAPSDRWQLVPFSLEVDDVGTSEHIVIVLSNHPLELEEAEDAMDGATLGGVAVQQLVLPKER
jgi:hypothetical protein